MSEAAQGLGLVAIGDSITRGGGDSMLGLHMQSWALWLAEALHLPYTCLAENGAGVQDALERQAVRLEGRYELGCIYLGVNDVRAPGYDSDRFEYAYCALVERAARHCQRLLLVALPNQIGRPPAPAAAIAYVQALTADCARADGRLLLKLDSLHGRDLVMPDAVHLTARGEAHMAMLACRVLAGGGFEPDARDLTAALAPLPPVSRARYMLGAGARALARDLHRRAREDLARRGAAS